MQPLLLKGFRYMPLDSTSKTYASLGHMARISWVKIVFVQIYDLQKRYINERMLVRVREIQAQKQFVCCRFRHGAKSLLWLICEICEALCHLRGHCARFFAIYDLRSL